MNGNLPPSVAKSTVICTAPENGGATPYSVVVSGRAANSVTAGLIMPLLYAVACGCALHAVLIVLYGQTKSASNPFEGYCANFTDPPVNVREQ